MGGCGCGGSAVSAQRVPREQVRQQPGASLNRGDGGFTWHGPDRPAPVTPAAAVAKPEPAKA
jgi:hypothetical protein